MARKTSTSEMAKKRKDMKSYPRGTIPYLQTATFTKGKEHIILNIKGEFLMEVI